MIQLMKEKKLSNKKLADALLVGERTIQRLRNKEEYPTTVQTVLGLCYGLQLSVPEAEMLVGKTDFNIKPTNPQNNAYRCVLSDEFSVNSIMNRIIKSTVEILLRSNISKQRKKNLRKLMLYFSEVDFIDMYTVNWNVQYNRNNQTYRMLISICYLVVKGLLQTQSDGSTIRFQECFCMRRLMKKYIRIMYIR